MEAVLCCGAQVRLLDFNPIGGTTSPLLFDWEELPYSIASPPSPPEASSNAAEHTAGTVADSHDSEAHDAASHSAAAAPGSQGRPEATAHANGRPSSTNGGATASESFGAREEGGAGRKGAEEIFFRLNTGGAVLRPMSAAYGAPYDMVDTSDGSAISEMLRQLQTQGR